MVALTFRCRQALLKERVSAKCQETNYQICTMMKFMAMNYIQKAQTWTIGLLNQKQITLGIAAPA